MSPMEVRLTPEWERRLNSFEQKFSPSERRVAQYILENQKQIREMTIGEIADLAAVSQATVVRFCHRLGYEGLKEFKISLVSAMNSTDVYKIPASDGTQADAVLHETFRRYIACLQDTAMIDNTAAFEQAVAAIMGAKKIDLYGVGGSASSVLFARHLLMKIGIRANECTNSHAQQLSATTLDTDDVVVVISNKGESPELLSVIPTVRERGAIVICITSKILSPIANMSDIVLQVAGAALLDTSTDPRVGIHAMLDALAHCIYYRKNGHV